jgi:hypothetical protein
MYAIMVVLQALSSFDTTPWNTQNPAVSGHRVGTIHGFTQGRIRGSGVTNRPL